VVLPALMPNGGVREALRLANDLQASGVSSGCRVISLWESEPASQVAADMAPGLTVQHLSDWRPSAMRAPWQWPVLAWRFWRGPGKGLRGAFHSRKEAPPLVLTHYTTLPLALLVTRQSRWFFVQDLEWLFLKPTLVQRLAKWIILAFLRRGRVLTTNSYLKKALTEHGVDVQGVVPTWADEQFGYATASPSGGRSIDVVLVLRRGAHKWLQGYEAAIGLLSKPHKGHPPLRVAVITPDAELASRFQSRVQECLYQPQLEEMRALYARSRCLLHLSEHEGFGLPPLEAMGAGCIPICRDSGGVQTYMQGPLQSQLLPREWSVEIICEHVRKVLADTCKWQALSEASRHIFLAGLVNSENRFKVLASIMQRPIDEQPY
jgi:glycosyltransferase involved in cell wall biosynthesis